MSLSYGGDATPGRRDPVLKPYRPLRVGAGWAVAVLAAALVGGDLLWRVLRFGGAALPYGLTDGVILAALLAKRITAAVHGPPTPWPAAPPAPTTEPSDRPFAGVRRWEDRLAWTHDDPVSVDRTVRPQLARLVDERLRHAYGIDLAGTGAGGAGRVRALLGDPLWTFLTEPVERAPGPAELSAVVDGIRRLFD